MKDRNEDRPAVSPLSQILLAFSLSCRKCYPCPMGEGIKERKRKKYSLGGGKRKFPTKDKRSCSDTWIQPWEKRTGV